MINRMKKERITMSRIEQMISDIESYIDNCKFQPLSNTKIIVNKEQLEDMLTELRLKTLRRLRSTRKFLTIRMLLSPMPKSRRKL